MTHTLKSILLRAIQWAVFYDLHNKLAELGGFYIEYRQLPAKSSTQGLGAYLAAVTPFVDIHGGRIVSETSLNRLLGVDFSSEIVDGSQVLVLKSTPKPKQSIWKFTSPFTSDLWGIIVALLIFNGAVFYYFKEPEDKAGDFFVGSMGHFVNGGELKPKKIFLQLLNIGFCFCCTILSNTYTANLASSLISASQSTSLINGIDDTNRLRSKVCVQSGTASASTLTNYFTGVRSQLQPIYAALGLAQDLCVAALIPVSDFDIATSRELLNPSCNLVQVGGVVRKVSHSWGAKMDYNDKCTSFMLHALSVHFLSLRASGFMNTVWSDAVKEFTDLTCPAVVPDELSLDLNEMSGVFYLYLICLAGCLAIYYFGKKTLVPLYSYAVKSQAS